MKRIPMAASAILVVALISCGAFAQETEHKAASETKAEVPALAAFHDVIFKIWHTAWPNKDYAMLISLLPDIEKGADAVVKAELPGILRERKPAWNEGVKTLQTSVAGYKAAVDKNDNRQLMDAAEKLHMQYEKLVRTIRPVLKEMDEFHQVLYIVYHNFLPEDKIDSLKAAVPRLQDKIAALNGATLPERLKKKEGAFHAARARLAKSVDALAVTVKSDDATTIKAAVNKMHTQYEMLEKVFE